MVIYQILPRLFGNSCNVNKPGGTLAENGCGKFSSIDADVLDYLKWLGVSHIYLTGIMPHSTMEAFEGQPASHPSLVKGRAGSPFAIRNHYDVAAYLADDPSRRMEEFRDMLSRIHAAGLKLIVDFVPNHVARDYESSPYCGPEGMQLGATDDTSVHWSESNDFYYYPGQYLSIPQADGVEPYVEYPAKASGNVFGATAGENDWWETIKINYCDYYTPTWEKMYSVLDFWAGMGVDGFRCDMVELVPPEFFKWAITRLKGDYPYVVFVAETYSKEQYNKYIREVGFDCLYDKSGMYDTLKKVVRVSEESDRQPWQSSSLISSCWQYLGDNQPFMLNFLENHDEVRFASEMYAGDGFKVPAPLAVSLFLNRASFMLYAGCEFGEKGMESEGFSGLDGKTSIFDWWSPSGLQRLWSVVHSKEYLKVGECGKDGCVVSAAEAAGECGAQGCSATGASAVSGCGCADGAVPVDLRLLAIYHAAICKKRTPLIECGLTYDLGYCNHFPGSIFAFIRSLEGASGAQNGCDASATGAVAARDPRSSAQNELFVCNFADIEQTVGVMIPQHAFNYLPLQQHEGILPGSPIRVTLPAHGYTIVKL